MFIFGKKKGRQLERKVLDDKRKFGRLDEVNKLVINTSSINVNFIQSDSTDIEVYLHGIGYIKGEITFNTELIKGTLQIDLDFTGHLINSSITLDISIPKEKKLNGIDINSTSSDMDIRKITSNYIDVKTSSGDVSIHDSTILEEARISATTGDIEVEKSSLASLNIKSSSSDVDICFTSVKKDIAVETVSGCITIDGGSADSIKLKSSSGDVELDHFEVRKDIFIETTTGDVDISNNVSAEEFNIKTSSGDIYTSAILKKAVIETTTGDVDAEIDALDDISLRISTRSGDVNVELNNIKTLQISPKTRNGYVDVDCSYNGKYNAELIIETTTGGIEIGDL